MKYGTELSVARVSAGSSECCKMLFVILMLTISQNLDRQASQSCAYIFDTCSLAFSPKLLRELQYSFYHGNIKDKIYYIHEVAGYFSLVYNLTTAQVLPCSVV